MSAPTMGYKFIAIGLLMLAALALMGPAVFGADSSSNTITDVIVGRNTKGPYNLSWTNVDLDSMRVVVNGLTLKRGEKYNVDVANGIISFTSNVLTDAIVRVTYDIIPGKSKENSAKVNVPVTLNVFQRRDTSLQVTGLYRQDDPNNPDAGKTVVGLGGEKTWNGGKLGSQFFVSQKNADGKVTEGQAWDRSAFKVGSETTLGMFRVGGSLAHSGKDFLGGAETGLGTGKRASDLSVAFAPASSVEASARVQQTEDTGGATKGNRSTSQEQNLTVAPDKNTRIALTHSQTDTSSAAPGAERTVGSTAVKVDRKLGGDTKASVTASTSTTETSQGKETIQSQKVAFDSRKASGQASLTRKDAGAQQEQSYVVGGKIKPIDQMTLEATVAATDSTTQGQSSKTDLAVQANPFQHTQIQGRVVTDIVKDTQCFQRDFSLVSQPLRFAKVSASLSQKGVNQDDDVTKAATVEVTPFADTQLSAGVKYVETGARVMTVKDYAASAKACNLISFSGSLRQREVINEEAQDSTAMQVALTPAQFLSLTGGYQSNPEDERGNVQVYNATNVGLAVKFGSVGVTTQYQARNEYRANRLSDEGKLGLELPAFGGGKLSTGVKIARMLDGSMLSTSTYSLGYKHSLSSFLDFSLTGYYTQYLKDKSMLPDKTEYSAEANLGVKF